MGQNLRLTGPAYLSKEEKVQRERHLVDPTVDLFDCQPPALPQSDEIAGRGFVRVLYCQPIVPP